MQKAEKADSCFYVQVDLYWIECHWKPEIPFIKMEKGTLQKYRLSLPLNNCCIKVDQALVVQTFA